VGAALHLKAGRVLTSKGEVVSSKEGWKWSTLRHNGVSFPPPYEARGLSITIRGRVIRLTPEQEEMAWAWVKKRRPYVEDEVFASNFLSDFLRKLPSKYSDVKIDEIDFSEIARYQEMDAEWRSRPEIKKRLSAERREIRRRLKDIHGYAEVDGHRAEIANWMVEPPGIFMGRGAHPLRGRWKPRIYPEDVTLNLDEDAPIPPGRWGGVVHDHTSMWLASWVDKLTGKVKYVWLHDSSRLRQERDKMKYDLARRLEPRLEAVRGYIKRGMASSDEKIRKIASVCYLIDKLCMRVGDEKDKDEADTVGASTLRVEHVRITGEYIHFDFLGKDSVRWEKSIRTIDEDSEVFRENLEEFIDGKKPGEPLFDGVRSSDVNRFLGRAMNGLTAKVFRTFHATEVVRGYLLNLDLDGEVSQHLKLYHAKIANLRAAVACNHKRTPPKNWEASIEKKRERLQRLMSREARTERAKVRLKESVLKAELAIKLAEETKDYNLNTSLRNYIDPRVYKSWADYVELDWRQIYSKTLQRKFEWASRSNVKWPK